jgi:hypothetical protein
MFEQRVSKRLLDMSFAEQQSLLPSERPEEK